MTAQHYQAPYKQVTENTHLDTASISRPVRPGDSPLRHVRGIRLRDTDGKFFEYSAEELEIGELDGVNPDIFAQLDNHKMVFFLPVRCFGSTRTEHVPVLL